MNGADSVRSLRTVDVTHLAVQAARHLQLAETAQARADAYYAAVKTSERRQLELKLLAQARDGLGRRGGPAPDDAEVTLTTNLRVADDARFKMHTETASWHREQARTYAAVVSAVRDALALAAS